MFFEWMILALWISLIAVGIFVIRRRNPKHRKRWIGGWIFFVLLLWILSDSIPLLYTFPSAEEAFQYEYAEEIKLKVEGYHTCLLVGENHEATVVKTASGWKNNSSLATSQAYLWQKNDIFAYVLRHKPSGDCYVAVGIPYLLDYEITDSNQSTFYKCPDMASEGTQAVSFYYAYVGSVEKDYTVKVNGIEFRIT